MGRVRWGWTVRASTTTTRSSRRTCGTGLGDETPNDTLEKPDLLDLIGSAAGLRVLDLGCGDAEIGKELLAAGSQIVPRRRAVTRTWSGPAARRSRGPTAEVVQATHRGLGVPGGRVRPGDLADGPALRRGYRGDVPAGVPDARPGRTVRLLGGAPGHHQLRPGPAAGLEAPGLDRGRLPRLRQARDDTGWARTSSSTTTRWRSTSARCPGAGFLVEGLREGRPRRERFLREETYLRRLRIPLLPADGRPQARLEPRAGRAAAVALGASNRSGSAR